MAERMKSKYLSKRGSKMRGIQLLKLYDFLTPIPLIPVSMYKISKYKLLVTM